MALVAAKCTQCGANLEVDETKEAGICKYCGTAFITEKAINNYNINNTVHIQSGGNVINIIGENNSKNYLELARRARQLGDINGASEYYGKVLEENPDNWECSFFVGYYKSCIYKPLDNYSTVNYYTKSTTHALTLIKEEEKKEALNIISNISEMMASEMITEAEKLANSGSFGTKVNLQLSLHNAKVNAMEIYRVIGDNIEIIINEEQFIIDYAVPLWKKFISVGIKQELSYLNFNKQDGRDEFVKKLDNYAEKIKKYEPSYVRPKGEHESGACYIATCVYGSYDCPEVWTLRRFRDNTLDKTWYGRLFIKFYYTISPKVVRLFGEANWFKVFWKSNLNKIVSYLNNKGVDNTRYMDKY